MKSAILSSSPKPFVPVTIALTFESQEELDAMGKLFNSARIHAKLNEISGKNYRIWQTFSDAGANLDGSTEFWQSTFAK